MENRQSYAVFAETKPVSYQEANRKTVGPVSLLRRCDPVDHTFLLFGDQLMLSPASDSWRRIL
ncbi:MAG: hypothetical protein PVJ62_01260 [Deltaproteobacteria bacterium]|jgi:hypothetical protein